MFQARPQMSEALKPLLDAVFKNKGEKNHTIAIFDALSEEVKTNAKESGLTDFLVYKAFGQETEILVPLAKHLIETRWSEPAELIAKYAAVVGFQCETALKAMHGVQDELNQNMAGFGFDEKVSLKNGPLEDLFELSRCVLKASPEPVREAAKTALAETAPKALETTTLFEIEAPAARPRFRR
jgi:hypothetical protein